MSENTRSAQIARARKAIRSLRRYTAAAAGLPPRVFAAAMTEARRCVLAAMNEEMYRQCQVLRDIYRPAIQEAATAAASKSRRAR